MLDNDIMEKLSCQMCYSTFEDDPELECSDFNDLQPEQG